MLHRERSPILLNGIGDKLNAHINQRADAAYDDECHPYPFAPQPYFGVDRSDLVQAQRLKRTLMEQYHAVELADAIKGDEFITEQGACYHVETTERMSLSTIS